MTVSLRGDRGAINDYRVIRTSLNDFPNLKANIDRIDCTISTADAPLVPHSRQDQSVGIDTAEHRQCADRFRFVVVRHARRNRRRKNRRAVCAAKPLSLIHI